MRRIGVAAVAATALAIAIPAQAGANVTGHNPAEAAEVKTVAEALAADPTQITGASSPEYAYEGSEGGYPIGVGDISLPAPQGVADFPTSGDSFAILSSGEVEEIGALLVNEDGSTTGSYSEQFPAESSARGAAAKDYTVVKVDVEVPGGNNCLALDYRFLSEEFPEFVGSPFNDAFIAEVGSSVWKLESNAELGITIHRPTDFASDPSGTPISVNGVGPTSVSPAESAGTYFDAATGLVTTKTPITSGPHSVYFSIFDATDQAWDSAILLDNLRFINESPATCKPPIGKELEIPATPPPAAPSSEFDVGPKVKFKSGGTKATLTVTVPGPGVLTAKSSLKASANASAAAVASKRKARRKFKRVLLPAKVRANAAGPVKITVKLSGTGKAVLAKRRKLKVPITLTFTADGGSPASKTVKVTFKKKRSKCRSGKCKRGKRGSR